jgi:saccharopine dehydrogenase-like NADP-dependent oxidoreductase
MFIATPGYHTTGIFHRRRAKRKWPGRVRQAGRGLLQEAGGGGGMDSGRASAVAGSGGLDGGAGAAGLRLLLLGGYGNFGGRLARLLAEDARLTLIIAGRAAARAEAFSAMLPSGAARLAAAFDRDGDLEAQLRRLAPDLVVDASGPFQAYGAEPYRLVEAALGLGIDYIDLADGADFVAGIAACDPLARAHGRFALAGASTCPALTVAVVRELARGLRRLDTVQAGIVPSPRAKIGEGVVRALLGYAGKPIRLWHDGKPTVGHALTESRRFTVRPPGGLPLRRTRFLLVDVPEHRLLPRLRPELKSVWFGAGMRPGVLRLGLAGFAWLVRLRLLPSLAPLSGVAHWLARRLRWGEHRSGMFVAVSGLGADGAQVERSWHLAAEGDDGPFIPAMAAAALIRRCLDGQRPAPGARPAVDDVTLADYAPFFAGRRIVAGFREAAADRGQPLYRRVLGDAYTALPAPLRAMHALHGQCVAEGRAQVTRGANLASRLIALAIGFPAAGEDVPVRVEFTAARGVERWRRQFDGRSFASALSEGRGRWEGLLVERFGPFRMALAPLVEERRLVLVLRDWSCLGLPLPLWIAPRALAYEHDADGRFNFHVEISLPLAGPIVGYAGWLEPRG